MIEKRLESAVKPKLRRIETIRGGEGERTEETTITEENRIKKSYEEKDTTK